MNPLWQPVIMGVLFQVGLMMGEVSKRWSAYRQARAYCDKVEKPLLRVGMRKWNWEPPDADVTCDIDPSVTKYPGGQVCDIRTLPFEDKHFGACLVQHVLEHLSTPDEAYRALAEAERVADKVWVIAPDPLNLLGVHVWGHHLIVSVQPDGMVEITHL